MHLVTPVVKKILIINILIFFVIKIFNFDFIHTLGLRNTYSDYFRPYQLFTHLFIHSSFGHLLSNMFALLTFGSILEMTIKSKNFIIFYLTTGIGASLLYLLSSYFEYHDVYTQYITFVTHPTPELFDTYIKQFSSLYNNYYGFIYDFMHDPNNPAYIEKSVSIVKHLYSCIINIPCVGASGAIFGILTAFAMFFPNARLSIFFLPIGVRAKYIIIFYGLYELYASMNVNDNIAHFAHIGGIIIAYFFIKFYKKLKRQRS